jgi:putative transposase
MSVHRFSTGKQFDWNGSRWEVKRPLPEGKINIEDMNTTAIKVVDLQELVAALFAGDLKFVIETRSKKLGVSKHPLPEETPLELSDYPEKWVARARFRLHVIKPLLALASHERTRTVIHQRIDEVNAEIAVDPDKQPFLKGLSWRSIFRWIRNYTHSGQNLRALIDHYAPCGGKGKSRLKTDVKNLVESVIKDHVYRREVVTIDDIVHFTAARMVEENRLLPENEQLKMPDRSTIARRIDALDLRDRFTAKHGQRAARHEFDQVGQMNYPRRALERVEIDDTRLDVMVIDEADNLPLGRPTLAYCLDTAFRYPLGYYVGFEPASYYAVLECLYHSICPKADVCKLYHTEHKWLAFGTPHTLIVDNARQFVGEDLEDACELLGIILIYAPVRTPEFKAGIERNFGTLNSGLFHQIPGTTFSNIFKRGDYDSVQQAVISLSELEQTLNIFVVDIYAERFHRGLNGIPARRWEAAQPDFFPRFPANKDELLILLGKKDYRVIQRYGIEFLRLRYNHPDLSRLRKWLKGEPVKFKYHPGDLSRLYVRDPFEKVYLEVPALDQAYTQSVSLWKHKVILNLARQEEQKVDLAALGRAKLKIQQIVDQARTRKRTSTRSRIARWDRSGQPPSLADKESEPADVPPALPDPQAVTSLLPDNTTVALPENGNKPKGGGWELLYVPSKQMSNSPEENGHAKD